MPAVVGCRVAYPTDDLVVVGQMRLARLAAVDLLRVEVDVVREAHRCGVWCRWALLAIRLLGSLSSEDGGGYVGQGRQFEMGGGVVERKRERSLLSAAGASSYGVRR